MRSRLSVLAGYADLKRRELMGAHEAAVQSLPETVQEKDHERDASPAGPGGVSAPHPSLSATSATVSISAEVARRRTMATMRALLRLALFVFAGWLLWTFVVNRPAAAPPETAVAPAATVPAAIGKQVDNVGKALTQAKQTSKTVPVTLTFTEQELTTAAGAYFPQSYLGFTLANPSVQLQRGQLTLRSDATLGSFVRTQAVAVGVPSVTAGRPAVALESAKVGGNELPDPAKQTIATDISAAIAAGVPANLTVTSITVANGTLTIQAQANP